MMGNLSQEFSFCLLWATGCLQKIQGSRWRNTRGQAVMEYFLLFIILGMLAAVLYRIAAPVLEGIMVRTAKYFIARNVAGE